MALTVLAPTPAAGKGIPVNWFTDLLAAINAIGNAADVTYASGNFTASGSQTWTVDSGDILGNFVFRYEKRLDWAFAADLTSVGGTPSGELRLTLPLGLTIAKTVMKPCTFVDNGTPGTGVVIAVASSTFVKIQKSTAATTNWTASTNLTSVYFQISIPTTT